MVKEDTPASILTNRHRDWLAGGDEPTHRRDTRKRIYKRVRATLTDDAELLAKHLEDGELKAGAVGERVVDEYGYVNLGDGIRDMVAALYMIGESVPTLDAEEAIEAGVEAGRRGRLAAIERKRDEGRTLSVGELNDVAQSDPDQFDDPGIVGWAQTQLKQRFNLGQYGGLFHDPDDIPGLSETDRE